MLNVQLPGAIRSYIFCAMVLKSTYNIVKLLISIAQNKLKRRKTYLQQLQ